MAVSVQLAPSIIQNDLVPWDHEDLLDWQTSLHISVGNVIIERGICLAEPPRWATGSRANRHVAQWGHIFHWPLEPSQRNAYYACVRIRSAISV